MHHAYESADITPTDMQNPFCNPTEEPGYTPDYRAIVPELGVAGCKLPLIPTLPEKAAIRRYISLISLVLLFAFLLAASISTALEITVRAVMQHIDAKAVGDLPQNYPRILTQYMKDSSIGIGINTVAFLCANLIAFRVGCLLTKVRTKDLFRTHGMTVGRVMLYILIGLWIQLVTGLLASWVVSFLARAGIRTVSPSFSLGSSAMKIGLTALYTCVIAPVTEELLMRGVILKNASRVSQRFGILLTAFLFSIMHENLPQFLFTFPLGILLGYITIRHNSLYPAILVHMAVNLSNFLSICASEYLPESAARIAALSYSAAAAVFGLIALIYLLATQRLPDQMPHQSIRAGRVAVTSPLLWVLVAVHVGMWVYLTLV